MFSMGFRRVIYSLCGDRVVQMTKTYNDIDAVTRLLEEKEKDLELAAKIGQTLLEQNKQLEKRIDSLEEQYTIASDQNTQLKHDMKLKEQLLRIYTNEVSYSDSDEDAGASRDRCRGVQSKFINIDALQKKVQVLEEENFQLRMDTAEMNTKTVNIEEKEAQLVQDAFKQLGETQAREGILTDELSKRLEETYQQKEEITLLLAQVVDLQQKVKKLSIENEELQHQCQAARDAQQSLTKELQETRDKSDEYVTMLNEARSEAKEIHRRSLPKSNLPSYNVNPLPVFPPDSLAAELVNTVEQELVGADPKLSRRANKREQNKNILKTVRDVNRATSSRAPSEYGSSDFFTSRRSSPGSSVQSLAGSSNICDTPLSEQYEGDNESNCSPSGSMHLFSRTGIPGSNDLETALRRLQLRKENEDAEKKYIEAERVRWLRHDSDADTAGSQTPTCPSPGSIWSTESFGVLPPVGHGFRSYMPEKLQIVKPMEGSMTLYHWQRLAQPHMASVLDVRPGVMIKGFRELERDPAIYSMDDVEDDGRVIERTCVPSKCYVSSCSTYTYTTSTIGLLENTLLTSSNQGPRMANSEFISKVAKPIAAKTFSTSLGLAQVLGERDVDDSAEPKVLTKVEAVAINPAGVNAGLNMFGVSPQTVKSASEAKRETSNVIKQPQGMHRVSSRIYSRFAVPLRTKNITDALDPDTKARLMEKVRKIRAEKETSERRARTLQCKPSIPSIRTKDVVMSPVRTPRPCTSIPGLSDEASCIGLEGAVGGYSPPGSFGSHPGTVHRNSGVNTDAKPKKLFLSDDSGVEAGFGVTTPELPSTVSNVPFEITFTGTVCANRSVPGFNTVLQRSSTATCNTTNLSFPHIPGLSDRGRHSQGTHDIGLLDALDSGKTISNSNSKLQTSSSAIKASTALSHSTRSQISSQDSFSQSSRQYGLASLTQTESGARPRTSISPSTNLPVSEHQSQGSAVGLASVLGSPNPSRPSQLFTSKGVEEKPPVHQPTTQGISPIPVLAGNLFHKPDHTL